MLLLFLWIATAKLSCDFASMLKLDASAGFYTYNTSLLTLGIALYATHTHTTVTMDVVFNNTADAFCYCHTCMSLGYCKS